MIRQSCVLGETFTRKETYQDCWDLAAKRRMAYILNNMIEPRSNFTDHATSNRKKTEEAKKRHTTDSEIIGTKITLALLH